MTQPIGRTVLITGASSGIGKAISYRLLSDGWYVYATARRTEKLKDLEQNGANILPLDVSNEISIQNAWKEIVMKKGGVDVLINNAGYGEYGAIEDVLLQKARYQFEVNVFGMARLTQLVLPSMRKKGAGRIVNISSIGGKLSIPLGGWYHATKHAVEALSDALRIEVEPFGIDVIVVEPGAIRSEWSNIALNNLEKASANGNYMEITKAYKRAVKLFYNGSEASPKIVADVIAKAINRKHPKARYLMPLQAKLFCFIRWILPDRAFDTMIRYLL